MCAVACVQGYVDYINTLPLAAVPGVFGLHDNAAITKDIQESQQLLDGLLLSQPTSGSTSNHGPAKASSSTGADTAAAAAATAADNSEGSSTTAAAAAAAPEVSKSREDVIADMAADVLAQLPANFDIEAAEAAYPQDYFNSMNTVLVQVCVVCLAPSCTTSL